MNETQTQLLIQYLRKINDNLERIANALEKENTATVNSDVDLLKLTLESQNSSIELLESKVNHIGHIASLIEIDEDNVISGTMLLGKGFKLENE